MLTHIVVWKYRSEVSQEVRDEHLKLNPVASQRGAGN